MLVLVHVFCFFMGQGRQIGCLCVRDVRWWFACALEKQKDVCACVGGPT